MVCEACDRVLLRKDAAIESVAITWLHVIREHPVFLGNYSDVISPPDKITIIIKKFMRKLRSWAGWLRQLGRSILANRSYLVSDNNRLPGTDILFVSHLLNASQAGQEDDFYFGNLSQELHKYNISSHIVLINHSAESSLQLSRKWENATVPRVVLSSSLKLSDEISLYKRHRVEANRLKKLAIQEKPGLYRRVLNRASEEALSVGSHTTMRIAVQISKLVRKIKPKAIVVTYEGHAWERVVFAYARKEYPDIKCIGYHHSALFRFQHAVRRNLSKLYNPDHILTTGEVTRRQLQKVSNTQDIPISVLGSKRALKKSIIKNDHDSENYIKEKPCEPVCLVLPEGFISECFLLFEFSLECAKVLPHIKFIWRLHPLLSFDSIMKKKPALKDLPGNIELSNATIEADLARGRWALYRGSTAIIQAVSHGLQPLYFDQSGEMTIDPLYGLEEWRINVSTVSEFKQVTRDRKSVV